MKRRSSWRPAIFTALAATLGLLNPQPSRAQPLPDSDRIGMNVHELIYRPEAFPLTNETRAGWTRVMAWWREMEPVKDSIDFSQVEAQVDAAIANGQQVLLTFASIPSWANGSPVDCGIIGTACAIPPTNPAFFESFAERVATHFAGRVTYFEIWNEPDYNEFWNGDFGVWINQILLPGSAAVKRGNASAKVVGPALYNGATALSQALSQGCASLDIISVHVYRANPGGVFNRASTYYNSYVTPLCPKPFWITETGFDSRDPTIGEAGQATSYAALVDGVIARPWIAKLFLFQWSDGDLLDPKSSGIGVVGTQVEGYRRKPSFWSFQDRILASLGYAATAVNPAPDLGATNITVGTALTWTSGARASQHRVYFGSPAAPTLRATLPLGTTTWTPPVGERLPGTSYGWRIDEVDGDGSVTRGTSWHFTTRETSPAADVIWAVDNTKPYYLALQQGFATANHAPLGSVTAQGGGTTANADNLWNAQHTYRGLAGLNVFTSAGTEDPPILTVNLTGMAVTQYDVYVRYVTNTTAPEVNGVRAGFSAAALTLFDKTNPATTLRSIGNWVEREALLGRTTATGGAIPLYLGESGITGAAAWSGVRLREVVASTLPGTASNPNPGNGATGVSRNPTLTWTAGANATSHRVSFGTTNPPPVQTTQTATSFTPTTLSPSTTYFWRIDEINASGTTNGPIWSFTTAALPPPVLVVVNNTLPGYLQVTQGSASPTYSPTSAVVAVGAGTTANADGFWNALHDYRGFVGWNGFAAAGDGTENVPLVEVALGGLPAGQSYDVYVRYVLHDFSTTAQGITVGLTSNTLAVWFKDFPTSYTLLRESGNYDEREALLGVATATGGIVRIYLENQGLAGGAFWSGVRLVPR
jgi:Glycosyl hydrolase catalytic core